MKYKAPNSGTIIVNIIKNERDPSLFMNKLLLKYSEKHYSSNNTPHICPSKVSPDSIMHQVIL
jgi:hypothetical protein